MGKRPQLTDELEALGAVEEEDDDDSKETELQTEEYKTLRFLIDIYRQCTQDDPYDRPTAIRLYKMLLDFSNLTSQQV